MALKFNDSYANAFVSEAEISAISSEVLSAQKTLLEGTGEGNGFLGWVTLPDDYDKEEFARIKTAAKKIQKNLKTKKKRNIHMRQSTVVVNVASVLR